MMRYLMFVSSLYFHFFVLHAFLFVSHYFISVLDMNDNPPKFEQTSYNCVLSGHASRGQFVTVVSASDPDEIDQEKLLYTIAQGNEMQTYSIDPITGIITLVNMQNFADKQFTTLNISVTDGVYTCFARVQINILPVNLHNPSFPHSVYDVKINENQLAGRLVIMVSFSIYIQFDFYPITDKINGKFERYENIEK